MLLNVAYAYFTGFAISDFQKAHTVNLRQIIFQGNVNSFKISDVVIF